MAGRDGLPRVRIPPYGEQKLPHPEGPHRRHFLAHRPSILKPASGQREEARSQVKDVNYIKLWQA